MQKTSTRSSKIESPTQAQIEEVQKKLSPEQEYLELLRKRIESQDKLILEIGNQVKMLAENQNNTVRIQNEIAKQVMVLTEAIGHLQEIFAMPDEDYRFFTTDDPYN